MRPMTLVLILLPAAVLNAREPLPKTICLPCLRGLETRSLAVTVRLDTRTAVTSVEHVVGNPGRNPHEEAEWLFPLPRGAAVESFTLMIDGKETPAELIEAGEAEKIYTEIVRRARDPALLTHLGGGLFRARIFPVPAGGARTVRLRYREVLTAEDGLFRYRYPLRGAELSGDRIQRFDFRAEVAVDEALQTVYAPSHAMTVDRPDPRRASLRFSPGSLSPDRDIEILYATGEGFGIDLLTHTDEDGGYFWLTLAPNVAVEERIPKDIALVLDNSGSMTDGKLETAVRALSFCLDNLGPDDRFEIVRFSTGAEPLAGAWLPATRANRQRAKTFIEGFRPIGGTNLEAALAHATALPTSADRAAMIVLITDGKPTVGETREEALLTRFRAADFKGRLFSFGIGHELEVHLLDKLARAGGGRHTYASTDEDLELKLSGFVSRLQSPVMTRPSLRVEGMRVSRMEPGVLPDLFRGVPLHIFGRYQGSGPAEVVLEGTVNGQRQTVRQRLRFARKERGNTFIPDLWARRRVGFLLDQIRLNGEDRELVEEVTRLAKRHGIVTPYSSMLILEDEAPHPTRREVRFRERDVIRLPEKSAGRAAVQASEDLRALNEQVVLEPEPVAAPRTVLRSVAGRSFYREGETWIEATLSPDDLADRSVRFGSDAYFDLLGSHPHLAEILAMSKRVVFRLDQEVVAVVL